MTTAAIEERARAAGRRAFGDGWRPTRRAVAPGRIELLGNHLDYNGGPVLAAAIDRFVVVLAADDGPGIGLVAADAPEIGRVELDPAALAGWRTEGTSPRADDYARGAVAAVLARPHLRLRDRATLAVAGDVPIGFGLSSSAALCVALVLAITDEVPAFRDVVLTAQEAEHRAGTPCGTMDQSTSLAGGVVRFEAAPLGVERLSPDLGELAFAVADSGVERNLAASAYPRRVEESREALARLRSLLGIELLHLAALTAEQWGRAGDGMPAELAARVRHVVTETERVEEGAVALREGDWPRFGRLMTASGRSSATDYAISHPRVEELVGETIAIEGVLGARMMGGGEGGAVLILLRRESVPGVERALRAGYYRRYGMEERRDLIHVCAFAEGARVEAIG